MNLTDLCIHIYIYWVGGLGEPAQGGLLHVLGPPMPPRPLGRRPRGPRTSGRGMAVWIAGLDSLHFLNDFARNEKLYFGE